MIIHKLSASSLLKYTELNLDALPESGVLAVSGPNESGKSTVGETLCFALFGRTFALDGREPRKLIRWSASRCSASAELTSGGARYRIERYLDDEGTRGARLERIDGGEATLIAQGSERVDTAVVDLLGYDFDSFIESFYLAQREITTPHAHSQAVKSIAGVAPFEQVGDELREALAASRSSIAACAERLEETEGALAELDVDYEQLPRLRALREETLEREKQLGADNERVTRAAESYGEALAQRGRTRGARGRARFGALLMLLLTAAAAVAWYLLARMPEHPLSTELSTLAARLGPELHAYAPMGAAVLAGVLLLFALLFMGSAAGKSRRLREVERELDDTADRLYPLYAADQAGSDDLLARIDEATAEYEYEEEEPTPDEADAPATALSRKPRPEALEQSALRSGSLAPTQVKQKAAAYGDYVDTELDTLGEARERLEGAIENEESRQAEARPLEEERDRLVAQRDQEEQRNRIRQVGLELLAGAVREVSHRFNHDVRGAAGRFLPRFTEGRYEHIRIDPSLTVQVFSSEKGDLMDLDEVSSGTQRQIMLALRLALAQQLVERTGSRPQFVFLDEPFAFFDAERTASALAAMPGLSADLPQIWVTSQQFPEDAPLDGHIHCRRDTERLSWSGAGAKAATAAD